MKVDISIIIVNYNTLILLKKCLNSIYLHTKELNFEIIVVDNASNDGSCDMIIEEFPNVILIESKDNLGFGKANNEGAKIASGSFLFLLNSDTLLLENSIKILKDFFENSNDISLAVVGCKLLDSDSIPNNSYGNFPSIYQELFEYGLSKIFKKYYDNHLNVGVIDSGFQIKRVDYIIGADMLIKKEIFDSIGGFDEDFFMYYEETEMCYRLNKLGYKIIYNPNTSIIHYNGASGKKTDGMNYWILELFFKSKMLYYQKCHGNTIALIAKYLSLTKALIQYRNYNTLKILRIFYNL